MIPHDIQLTIVFTLGMVCGVIAHALMELFTRKL